MSPQRSPLRVAVVSRYRLVRAGLTALLAEHPDRVIVADVSGQDGRLGGHDVAIYDLAELMDTSDSDLRQLVGSGTPVVALMPSRRPDLRGEAVAAGVAEVVAMEVTSTGLVEALERAACSQPAAAEQITPPRRHAFGGQHGLTDRETDIVLLIASGMTNQEIADRLHLSINSIKSYVRSGYKKMGVLTRAQAVLWVYRQAPGHLVRARSAGGLVARESRSA
jgi:DNA-binding NarL/FixJ family response regulator